MSEELAIPLLGRTEIEKLLRELGLRLEAQGQVGELYVVGGAAIALAYDVRRTTRDIDAVFEPKMIVYRAAAQVAEDFGIEKDWLNDAVKGLLPGSDENASLVFEAPGIRVSTASPEYLLAMKVAAARVDRDTDDIKFLASLLGLTTPAEILDVVEKVWGGPKRLLPKAKFIVEEIFNSE